MEKSTQRKICIALIVISISAAVIIITCGLVASNRKKEPEQWILQSYGNNVALYNGKKIIEVYGSIALDTLPEDDRRQLNSGIAFQTREEALVAIEDFDG